MDGRHDANLLIDRDFRNFLTSTRKGQVMSDWQPGQSILTATDYQQWQVWRKYRILQTQRQRRAGLRRIDYYPSPEAARLIDRRTYPGIDGVYSRVIDKLLLKGAARSTE